MAKQITHLEIRKSKLKYLFIAIIYLSFSFWLQARPNVERNISKNIHGRTLCVSADKAAKINGMPSNAKQIASRITIGWNLGNTLEACNDDKYNSEISWGNPKVTQEMIDAVKAAGFNAIRIPVQWNPHFTYKNGIITIDEPWMARVKEVIDYCLKNKMYVIVNIHHEKWLDIHATYADSAAVYRELHSLWTVLAKALGNYGENVMFAGTNEVKVNKLECTAENALVQNHFNQVFIDAVRATGGKNRYRNLIVQTYNCNDTWGIKHFTIPKDQIKGRIMVEFHCYDPREYSGHDIDKYWGKPFQRYGMTAKKQEKFFLMMLDTIKTKFIKRGYPTVMGEWGAIRHKVNANDNKAAINKSREYYITFVLRAVKSHGIVPFWWDNGYIGEGDDQFGLFDRHNNMKQADDFTIKCIMKAVKSKNRQNQNRK